MIATSALSLGIKNTATEGEIWNDDKRFYVFQTKTDRKQLKEVRITYWMGKESKT